LRRALGESVFEEWDEDLVGGEGRGRRSDAASSELLVGVTKDGLKCWVRHWTVTSVGVRAKYIQSDLEKEKESALANVRRRGVEPLPLAWKASMITASPSACEGIGSLT
jgi:hypothetical protein